MGRGMLKFKGEPPKKKKNKQKHAAPNQVEGESLASESIDITAAHPDSHRSQAQQQHHPHDASAVAPEPPQINTGSGRITTSGTVVTGLGTKFESEIAVGDAMIVIVDGQQEMRVIKMRLSNTSCGISSAFSKSLVTPTSYQIIRKPKNSRADEIQRREQAEKERQELEQTSFGTFRGTNELVYRERTVHGSYRIQKLTLDGERSRTELLSLRAKKTSDKYC